MDFIQCSSVQGVGHWMGFTQVLMALGFDLFIFDRCSGVQGDWRWCQELNPGRGESCQVTGRNKPNKSRGAL